MIDKQDIRLIKQNPELGFANFYQKTVDIFFRFIKSRYNIQIQDIEDILSDTYLKIWNNINKIDREANYQSYIWLSLRNTTKDRFKKKKIYSFGDFVSKNHEEDSNITIEETITDDSSILDDIDTQRTYDQISAQIANLDEISADILYMRYTEGRDYITISQTLGISQDLCRQKISRSIKKLKNLLSTQKT